MIMVAFTNFLLLKEVRAMKAKRMVSLLFVICILLSACGKDAPEAGSQPGTSSHPPASSSTGTTAPPTTATTAPPTTAPPIKQEVTPKASFVWNGSLFTDGTWSVLDKKNVEFDFDVPGGPDWLSAEVPEPVYYGGYLTTLLKTAPDDAYYLVIVDTGPADLREYGKPSDASEELDAIEKKNREELHRRRLEAG